VELGYENTQIQLYFVTIQHRSFFHRKGAKVAKKKPLRSLRLCGLIFLG
jgi:hypothetical protein